MKILIDGDGCPVVDNTIRLAKQYNIECFILCDTSHIIEKPGAKTLTFSKGADSVDFALVNLVKKGDVVITQDYGLASMCLAKGSYVINQNGMEYTANNIDSLLYARHAAKKMRLSGKHLKGPKKRKEDQDTAFEINLTRLIKCSLRSL
ncbi:MAG: YaiI/YqxD family protein [Eubacteriales bacterium]